jgi:hypothetical protein
MSEDAVSLSIEANGEASAEGMVAKCELSPEEAMEMLRAGKVVEHARICRLKIRGEIPFTIKFRHCTLIQCEFDRATVKEDVCFASCTLDRFTIRRNCRFEKAFEIPHSLMNKVTIASASFAGYVNFSYTEFRGKCAFADCRFDQRVTFWQANFVAWTDFKKCEFRGEADFRSLTAQEGFVLTQCLFAGDFLFRGSTVEKKFQADSSRFEKLLDLGKAKLRDYVYLEGIEQGPEQRFAFLNAIACMIRVCPAQIEGRLASEQEGRHEDAMQEYGLLKKSYQELHRYDYEDWAFYRFKVNQRRAKQLSWGKPMRAIQSFADWLFLDVGCGYGTHPGRAIRMAGIIIFGFAFIYALNVELFYAEKLPFPDRDQSGVANRVMIGLITSVSVFTSGMGGIREVAVGWMNVLVMIESIMGTLLFGLFIVAFSRKVIR